MGNKILKDLLIIIGIAYFLGSYAFLSYIWIVAYNNLTKTVLLDINSIGEANAELALLIIGWPIVLYCIKIWFCQLWHK